MESTGRGDSKWQLTAGMKKLRRKKEEEKRKEEKGTEGKGKGGR